MTGTCRILTPTNMSFVDLPEDVVYHALSMCDVFSVICISQTSKYLHLLGLTPTVWRSLVEDLRNRGFIDRLSAADIRAMSTETLIAVVKRLVVGPVAWSPPKIQSPPRPTSFSKMLAKLVRPRGQKAAVPDPLQIQLCGEIVLHPALPPVFPEPCLTTFKLLRGGKYALFCHVQDPAALVCWRVAEDSLLGTYYSALPTPKIFDFEAEVFDGGERANIVILVYAETDNPGFIEIIHWDFATGETELLSTTACTDYRLCSSPKICSSLAAIRVYQSFPWGEVYVIINWNTHQHCKIICPANVGFDFCMELIPGFFIVTARPSSPNLTTEIRVGSVASLSGSWVSLPVGQHNTVEPLSFSGLSLVASNTVTPTDARIKSGRMEIHESPLQRDTYRVWLRIPYFVPRAGGLRSSTHRALICSFHLSTSGSGSSQFSWNQRSSVAAAPDTRADGISYSGHTQTRIWFEPNGTQTIFQPENHSALITLEMPEGTQSTRLVSHSGTLVYFTMQTVVLRYFE
ncbi:hypothetical protein C8R44DRAFT_805070 [Mycena epipterygia]|nr:hypothetical protein C8R44DRAFT_805070 [Mycena epipterygia]